MVVDADDEAWVALASCIGAEIGMAATDAGNDGIIGLATNNGVIEPALSASVI